MNYNRETVINIIRKIYTVYRGRHLVDILVIILSDYLRHKSTQDEWKESDHPRKENGQFGKGGGSSKSEKTKTQSSTIAGVKQGKPMSLEKAIVGVNPNYDKNEGYRNNCQSCIAVFEARLRGFNIKTLPLTDNNSKMQELGYNPNLAYIDKSTGKPPAMIRIKGHYSDEANKWLKEQIKSGERYAMSYALNGETQNGGHFVSIQKNKKGDIEVYDPQNGEIQKFDKIAEEMIFDPILPEEEEKREDLLPHIFRIDNVDLNMEYLNAISEKS